MNYTQNEKIEQVTDSTMVVGALKKSRYQSKSNLLAVKLFIAVD